MASFKRTITASGGRTIELPAVTCGTCRGIGYLTAPVAFESTSMVGPVRGKTRIIRAGSGDRCPFCFGRGWTAVLTSNEKLS